LLWPAETTAETSDINPEYGLSPRYNRGMKSGRPVTRRQFISATSSGTEPTGGPTSGSDSPASDLGYLVRFARPAMATDFQLFLVAGRDEFGSDAALAALDIVDAVESQLTVYRDVGEVVEINRRAASGPVPVEGRLFELLERAMTWHRDTDGAYDITSGPLSRAWGFSRRQGRVPDDAELRAALNVVGAQHVRLDSAARTVEFLRDGVEINLNSVGKGYALDRCREVLADFGVGDFLLHGGHSSVLAGGSPGPTADGRAQGRWTVGVGHPLRTDRRLAELYVRNAAVGTSGAGFQFFRHGGKRYGHILDPRTGMPAEGVFSVSVTAPTAAEADALSTAFYVLGCERAELYCATRPEIGFLMLLPSSGGSAVELVTCNLDDDDWRLVN
jgi:thiamine biosynthesis lipoprotein